MEIKKFKKSLALLLFASPWASAELIITGVIDGPLPGGLPKAIELYSDRDINDLSVYGIGSANNGGGTDGQEFALSGSLAAGNYLYIASELPQFTEFFGFTPDFTSAVANINGDDAIEVFKNNVVVDVFGDPDTDGTGQPWEYLDGWAYRVTRSQASGFDISEWSLSGVNALDGDTRNDSAILPFPVGSFTASNISDSSSSSSSSSSSGSPTPLVITRISSIQGNPDTYISNAFGDTDVSPLLGETVTVEAIVVGDFQDNDDDTQRNLSGFYLQEEAVDHDDDPRSSEGVFVFSGNINQDVKLGDKVQVTGEVTQRFGETQLNNISRIVIIKSHAVLPLSPTPITLSALSEVTLNGDGKYQPNLEAFEGMLVRFDQTLTISEQFQLGRFNEIKLVAGDRPFQFTQKNTPDALLFDTAQRQIGALKITYDDGLNTQNENINLLDGFADYNEATAKRMGDTVTGLTGVLDYKWAGNNASGATWRVRSHVNGTNQFTSTALGNSPNPRPNSFDQPLGNLHVASLNLLNFFTTLDDRNTQTAVGQSPRGADDLTPFGITPKRAEFDRQLAKITNAIVALDADILGLVEIENAFDDINDGSTAIEVLVNQLNLAAGETLYDYVYPQSPFVGTDAIAVAIIYKPNVVSLAQNANPALLDDTVAAQLPSFADADLTREPIFNGPSTNRVSLAATFMHNASRELITLAVNHFKSKGPSGLSDSGSLNFDQNDGAGFWNQRRLRGAMAVQEWLATSPTGVTTDHVMILGDLNAYAMEAPIQYLLNNGFNNIEGSDAYSFIFDGQLGTLDYLLISDALVEHFTTAHIWHINTDEANALDYNLDFGRSAGYFDESTSTRHSDHDPVVAGFEFMTPQKTYQPLSTLIQRAVDNQSLMGAGRHAFKQYVNLWFFRLIAGAVDNSALNPSYHQACHLLEKLAQRADAMGWPNDWVKGAARENILQAIKNNQTSLACENNIRRLSHTTLFH